MFRSISRVLTGILSISVFYTYKFNYTTLRVDCMFKKKKIVDHEKNISGVVSTKCINNNE